MAEWVASKGTTALGIIGTVLGGLATAGMGTGLLNSNGNYESSYATMHDINDAKELAYKDSEIAQLKAQQIVDAKIVDTYKELANKINSLEKDQNNKWAEQYVVNSQLNSAVNVVSAQVTCLQNTINNLTKVVIPITNVCPTPAVATTQATQ